jgi:hypothetical protein
VVSRLVAVIRSRAARLLVNARYAPPVAFADLVDTLAGTILLAGVHGDQRVVVAGGDDIADADVLVRRHPHAGVVGVGVGAVQSGPTISRTWISPGYAACSG